MTRLFALGLLVSLEAVAAPELKLAAPGLTGAGIDAAKMSFFTERLASALASPSLRVITQKEISAMLGLERQRQLLGCTDASSQCMAELAGALGVDGIVIGDLARLGTQTHINVKVIAAKDGSPLTSRSMKVDREEDIPDALERLGREMAAELTHAPAPGSTFFTLKTVAVFPIVVGVVAAVIGGVLFGLSGGYGNQLDTEAHLSLVAAQTARDTGESFQTAGVALLIGGAAVAVIGGVLFGVGALRPSPVAFWVPGGAGFGVAGALP